MDIYKNAQNLAHRQEIMQARADYPDSLRAGGSVIPMQRVTWAAP